MPSCSSGLVGVLLGFLLSLVAIHLKEKLEIRKKAHLMKMTLLFCTNQLRAHLRFNPRNFEHLNLNTVTTNLDVVFAVAPLNEAFLKILPIFLHWRNGSYFGEGLHVKHVDEKERQLSEIADSLDKLQPMPRFLRVKIGAT